MTETKVAPSRTGRRLRFGLLMAALCGLLALLVATPAQANQADWDAVADQMVVQIEQIPTQHAAGDDDAIQATIRQVYYEIYQVSGLEAQINHRLGVERAQAFVDQLLDLRNLARNGVSQAEIEAATSAVIELLRADVFELKTAPEVHDQWTRVATSIVELAETAKTAYAAGDTERAAKAATDAYLGHYEAQGLEKATIAYLGQGRVTQVEGLFQNMRQLAKNATVSTAEYDQAATELIAAITADATELDRLTSNAELGWSGFIASFLILLREGAEALLVVAAVVTYALKANRRDQLAGIGLGVVAALLLSIGLAVLFSVLASTASSGLGQELVEGVTGLLAVVMLIWVSNWVLSKASGDKWDAYIERTAGTKTATGGVLALAMVAFLAVLREGFETILFFSPILAAAKTGADHTKIWFGVAVAVAVLAILFVLVWRFGIRLPMRQFFKWTSILLGILAVTIAGGAVKEFQDATLVSANRIAGFPEISWLGIYPTIETLVGQGVVIAVLVILGVIASRQKAESVATVEASVNTNERNDQ